MKTIIAATALLSIAGHAPALLAQESKTDNAAEAKPQPAQETVQRVTVTSSKPGEVDQRRASTAAKIVIGREELDRNGDSTVGEVLKRLPGVTMGGRPGRGGEIRMRGLGSGYTQILLNGERPPAGFSLDTLSPDQIERIEVYRAPVAEFSTQAVAGTINIVLREDVQMKQKQVRLSDGIEQNRHAPNVAITHPGQLGNLSYLLSGTLFQNRQHDDSTTHTVATNAAGETTLDQVETDTSDRRSRGVQFAPRFSYRFDRSNTLVLQPFLMQVRSDTDGNALLDQTVGVPPFATAQSSGHSSFTVARLMGNWQRRLEGRAKLDLKFNIGANRGESETTRLQEDAGGVLRDTLFDASHSRERHIGTGGKYSTPIGEGHTAAFGWDTEWGWRDQTRVSLENGAPAFFDSGDNLGARTRRLAAFAQDEWDINEKWSAYLGLRWEGIRTQSDSAGASVSNNSSVISPILQAVYRIPGREKDQVRMSLTHAYRAPGLSDLIALPVISHINTPTAPDRIGNPQLKPELSTGVELAFEHYLSSSGLVSANLFLRDIKDLIRRETTLEATDTGARWVSRPVNFGNARAGGIELEAKFPLRDLYAEAPAVDLRSNVSRFWSSVDDVPGPNNRLDKQPKQTANFGLDWRLARLPLTLGGNINWTPPYAVQSTVAQSSTAGIKRQVDAYALWRFSPNVQLRLAANNLVNNVYYTSSTVALGGINQTASVADRTYTTWTLRLEMKI
ncbi:TonB-dependent receptor [Oxalobacteraceae bacterium OM1]|nr:TonB-dependent receptor [Oxalobacteraceae bacterium OM1]